MPRRHSLQITVRSVAGSSWELDNDPTGIWIAIPRAQLELLAQSLPSREGLMHEFALDEARQLQLMFEVDVRRKQRAAPA
jgi:hypothetical protein